MILYDNLPASFPAGETAVALGIFDGLHLGHMAVLDALMENARARRLAPCVFTFRIDAARPASKTGRSLLTEKKRVSLLAEIGIQYVLKPGFSEFKDQSPKDFSTFLVEYMRARSVFCGENFRFGKGAAAGAEDLKTLLRDVCDVHIIKTVAVDGGAVSTTRIRQLLQEGDVVTANRLLGRAFSIDFEVVHGRGLGHTIGLPTINQKIAENFIVPRLGVYASETFVDGIRYPSVTNVGVKPTVGGAPLSAETHLFDFSGDLYGKEASVFLLQFIRGEQKFKSLAELKPQIEKDSAKAREIHRAKNL